MPPFRTIHFLIAAMLAAAGLRAEVVISEFVAENDDGIEDVDGDNSDWIELHNNGVAAVNLTGWRITDNAGLPAKWVFPGVTLGAGERLVVFASEKDRRVAGAELHTNFKLENGGEYLALSKPDGTITTVFNPYPGQRADISFGEGTLVDGEDLITATSSGKILVPPNGALGTGWTGAAFNDAAWSNASSRIGYQTGATPPGLPIAYWTFDDTAANEIAGGPEVELVGAAYDAAVPGAIAGGKSLHFTRAGSTYATAALDVSETAYTSSFWFRTTSPTTGLYSVHSGTLGANGHDRHLWLTGGNIAVRTYTGSALATSGKNYADGQWHHLAHVYGGGVGAEKVYVDGVVVIAGTKAQSDFTWQDRVTIGFSNDAGAAQHHDGEIDDVAIWSEALNAASITSLASGTSPVLLSGFDPHIGTDVEAPLRNVNASLYLRLPFAVNRATPFTQAALRVRYDDGFIAYLDGVEIARRNAPATPVFNSAATLDRAADDAILLETIDLTAHVGLLGNGSHVLAIHALNDAAGSNEFLLNAELSAARLSQQSGIYFDPPSPGQPNTTGFAGFVADTNFLPKRGFYDTAQNVVISSATPGASLAYTTDGTDPTPTNGTQIPPANSATPPSVTLNVAATTAIRAMAYKSGTGMRATNVDSHTYIFPNQVLVQPSNPPGFNPQWNGRAADYGMDASVVNSTQPGYSVRDGLLSLPTISMTCRTGDLFDAPAGIYYDTTRRGMGAEKKVSLEWINPDGTPGWHAQAGVRLHGNSSRNHSFTPKHPLRLNFRDIYGTKNLKRDLFGGGADKFDQLILRGCSTDSFPVQEGNFSDGEQRWNNDKATYLRDQFIRDTLSELGWPNCRGLYCNLYINGLYWGLYNIAERPTAAFFAETYGGSDEDWDVMKDFQELNDGSSAPWTAMLTVANDTALSYEARGQKLIGNHPDGTRNPAYDIHLHLPSFIDYMIVHIAAGAEDWATHNYWAGRRRGPESEGFRFIAWDQEISNDSLTRMGGLFSGNTFEMLGDPAIQNPADRHGPGAIYDTLRRAPTFQKMFRERVHALFFNNGPLSPAANRARWMVRQAQIDKAIVAESARWGDGNGEAAKKRETTWLSNMAYMNTAGTGYWDAIFPIDIQRFRNVALYPSMNQPTLSQNGGTVPGGYELYFTSEQPAAWFTLDGSDPLGANGQPSASAQFRQAGYATTNAIPQGATWSYLVAPSAPAGAWKQLNYDDSAWPQGPAQLGYGDGGEATVIGFGGNTSARYITTYFRKKFTVTSVPQIAKLFILRDDGAVVYLNGKEVARSNIHPTDTITWSTPASTNVGGADESTYFYEYPLTPADFVVGENVLTVELHQVSATNNDLSFDARLEVLASAATSGVTLTQSGTVNVRARSAGGEWSGMNSAYFTVNSEPVSGTNVVVSELHYHPADPTRAAEIAVSTDPDDYEFIELMNIGPTGVDFTGAEFTAGFDFHFPTGYALAPGARCVIVKNVAAFTARYGAGRNIAGVFEGSTGLSNGGETLTLTRATALRTFAYDDIAPWPTTPDGAGPSLVLKSPTTNPNHSLSNNWIASADFSGTPAQSPAQMTFANWRTHFSDTLTASSDDDTDGIPAALEYALVLDPLTRNDGALPAAEVIDIAGQPHLAITFRRRAGADLLLAVETSENAAAWSSAPSVVLAASTEHGDGTVTETWRCAAAATSSQRQFLRLRATVAP